MLAIVGGALLVVLTVIVVVVLWRLSAGTPEATHTTSPTPSHTASATPTPTQSLDPLTARWSKAFALFDQRRTNAFARRDPNVLTQLYAPKSQAYDENRGYMRELAKAKVAKVLGLRRPISTLAPVTKQARRIVFEVVRRQQPYTVVMTNGQQARCPAGPEKKVRIEVVPLTGSTAWRISREWQVGGPTAKEIVVCTRKQAG